MSHPWPKKLALLLVLVPLLLTQGCPNTGVVGNSIGSLRVVSAASPSDTGRYEVATLTVGQIEVVPSDPDAAASLGGTSVGVLFDPVLIPLDIGQTAVGSTELTAGRYTVESIILLGFRLEDTTVPLPPPTQCLDLFAVLQRNFNPQVNFGDLDPPVEISVPQDGQGVMTITIDSPGLIALLESRFVCSLFNPCFNPPAPAPCIAGFVPLTSQDLEPYITVQ